MSIIVQKTKSWENRLIHTKHLSENPETAAKARVVNGNRIDSSLLYESRG